LGDKRAQDRGGSAPAQDPWVVSPRRAAPPPQLRRHPRDDVSRVKRRDHEICRLGARVAIHGTYGTPAAEDRCGRRGHSIGWQGPQLKSLIIGAPAFRRPGPAARCMVSDVLGRNTPARASSRDDREAIREILAEGRTGSRAGPGRTRAHKRRRRCPRRPRPRARGQCSIAARPERRRRRSENEYGMRHV